MSEPSAMTGQVEPRDAGPLKLAEWKAKGRPGKLARPLVLAIDGTPALKEWIDWVGYLLRMGDINLPPLGEKKTTKKIHPAMEEGCSGM